MSAPANTTGSNRFERWVKHRLDGSRTSRLSRRATGLLAALSIVSIGVIDLVSGRNFSFSMLYTLPVTIVTIDLSTRAGVLLSLEASLMRVVSDSGAGGVQGVLPTLWNLFGRFATLAILVVLIATLRDFAAELVETNDRTAEFLASAAHQLRTPIAGLVATAEALAFEDDEVRRFRLTDNLISATDRVGRLLNSLLQISRNNHAPGVDVGPVDLGSLCADLISEIEVRHPVLSVTLDRPGRSVVETDGVLVTEAVSNLLDNAARHAASSVLVRVAIEGDEASIEVLDDGPGIAPNEVETIFNRFVSIGGHGGAGLGLPIARDAARALGGDLVWTDQAFRFTVMTASGSDAHSKPAPRRLWANLR